MRKLLRRLILWAIAEEIADAGSGLAAHGKKVFELERHLGNQEAAWVECAKEIEALREKLGAQPEPKPQVRRVHWNEFRSAAEQAARKG